MLHEFKISAFGILQLLQRDASVRSERLAIGPLVTTTGSAAHMLKADDASFIVHAFPGAVIHAVKTCWMKQHHVTVPAAFPAVIEPRLQDAIGQCPIAVIVSAMALGHEGACPVCVQWPLV